MNTHDKYEMPPLPLAQHPDDAAVDAFAAAMKTKLAQKRAEGRGGWGNKTQCSQDYLSLMLRDHVAKGDPVDVANFAMMLHQRGERISNHDQRGLTNKEAVMNVQESCNHIYKAVPIDGSRRANVPCIPECIKCGYQPGSKPIVGVDPATNTDDGCIVQGKQLPDGRVVIDSVEYIKNPSKPDSYICTKCGADRSKEGCQNYNLLDCAFMGYGQTKEKK